MNNAPILTIRNLEVVFRGGDRRDNRRIEALRGLDLELRRGFVHALVGESGSGKSVTARSILGLLPRDRARVSAELVRYDGIDLLSQGEEGLREIRGSRISMIFQEPGKHLNPALRIGAQICEVIRVHLRMRRSEAYRRAEALLALVGLVTKTGNARRILRSYPHELSGGMKQRAMIAMALACDPSLLIADEPTTALDVTIQKQIIELIRNINSKLSMTVLFISHDLSVVHEIADVVSVIYAGKIVEGGTNDRIFSDPAHPYTRLLLASVPDPARRGTRLEAIPGTVPDAERTPAGCAFHPRCPIAVHECQKTVPRMRRVDDEDHTAACLMIDEDRR